VPLSDLWKLFEPLWRSVAATLAAWAAQLAPHVGKAPWKPPLGLPGWALVGGVVLVGWAVAEALSGLLKLGLRLAAVGVAVVIAVKVLA
jgi:hypothetical protein